jgi:septum site-determining protein MinC
MNAVNFQLKGSVVTAIVLELYQFSPESFAEELQHKVQQAPALFDQSAVVISLEKFTGNYDLINFVSLVEQCRSAGMQPMAFRGGEKYLSDSIRATGLAWLPTTGARNKDRLLETPNGSKQPATSEVTTVFETIVETRVEEKIVHRPSKVLTRPVRSGQQVYAEGADLIVMTQVSEGAEVLADGHIHVYGALRGRALAGVKGDKSARVFCQSLEAELISIAGIFMLSDELRDFSWKQPSSATLDNDSLIIDTI